jgi:hypothetical protein
MAYFPNPPVSVHPWNSLVVGGSNGNPLIATIIEQNLLSNGYFKDTLVGWDGTCSRIAYDKAMRGSYVLSVTGANYAHYPLSYTSNGILSLTGYANFQGSGYCDIYIYMTSAVTEVGSPSEYIRVRLTTGTGAAIKEWIPFYIMVDTSSFFTAGTYAHIEFKPQSGVNVYFDDLKLYEVDTIIAMDNPQKLNLTWQRKVDSEYELLDGEIKTYLKGWRASYNIGYEFCSAEQLVKSINVSENMFCLFVPQSDNLMHSYVRLNNDFSSSYFQDRFIGHSNELELVSIFLQRYKNKQYGSSYFTVTFEDGIV